MPAITQHNGSNMPETVQDAITEIYAPSLEQQEVAAYCKWFCQYISTESGIVHDHNEEVVDSASLKQNYQKHLALQNFEGIHITSFPQSSKVTKIML